MEFSLFARDGIFEARAVSGVDDALAQATEAGLAGHQEKGRVEIRMILAQILFSLVSIGKLIYILN